MADLSAERATLVVALEATGLDVADDPKKAHAPCILVGPITDVEKAGPCAWDCTVTVWLAAPAPGDAKAVDWLAANVTDVMAACGDSNATLSTLNVGQGDLPAYELTVNITAKE